MRIIKICSEDILTNFERQDMASNPDKKPSREDYKKDWLQRHESQYLKNGKWTFYHATPRKTAKSISFLKAGSLLTDTIERAIHFASRDRDLKEKDIVVFELTLNPNQFNAGMFPSIDEDIPLNSGIIRVVH